MVLKKSKGYMQNIPFTGFRSIRRFCTVPRDTFSACANADIDAHASMRSRDMRPRSNEY